MNFIEEIIRKAQKENKKIVLPETKDIRTIQAAEIAQKRGIADIILIGDEVDIKSQFSDFDYSGIRFITPSTYSKLPNYVDRLCEIRKSKNLTAEEARLLLQDPLYFGVMMVKEGDADGMVAGAANSTSNTLRPALQIIKTSKEASIVSSIHIMNFNDTSIGYKGTMIYGDTALNEDPSAEELAEIAVASAYTFKQLIGDKPKVAMLSYSSHGSAKSPLVDKVVEATGLAKAKAPDILIDGELQLDSAIVPSIGKKKAPESPVAGQANILIFPDLNAGNIGYKMSERLAGAEAFGAITQGLAKPINDMSRGCNAEDIVGVIAITVLQAKAI